jgi:fucose permease
VASSLDTLQLPVMWFSVTAFFIYTGLEAATGIWVYSLFTEARAIPEMVAGMWVSAYWGGLTIGRLASGIVIGFVSVHLLLRLCIISMALGAALIWLDLTTLLSFLGLLVIGVAAAPIFPSLIATTPARLGAAHTANGIGFQVAAAVLGQSLLPSLIGVLAQALGLEIVGPVLLTAALLLLVVYEALLVISPCNR